MSIWKPCLFGTAAIWSASPAGAHTFLSEGGFYDRFVEGTAVVLGYPFTLLSLAALGFLVSLWHHEGLLRVWPTFILAQLVGIGVAAIAGPWVTAVLIAIGVVISALAALLATYSKFVVHLAAVAIGVLVIAVSLQGHGLFELPLAIYLGVLCATNLAIAVLAALPRAALDWKQTAWMRIIWRIAASWIAAILILSFAFNVSN